MLAANAMGEEPVTFPDVEWEVRTPAEVDLDVAKLQELSAMVGGAGAIVRDGYMVYTWGDQSARSPSFAWASASKAVVSTMLFFAINEGRLSGPNVRVRNYVRQQFPGEDLIAKDVPMTFRHLANAQAATCCRGRRRLCAQRLRIQLQIPGVRQLFSQSDQRSEVTAGSRRPRAWARCSSRTVRSSPSRRAFRTPRARTRLSVLAEQGTVEGTTAAARGAVRYRDGAGTCESAAFDE
jgi:hypothetical protein